MSPTWLLNGPTWGFEPLFFLGARGAGRSKGEVRAKRKRKRNEGEEEAQKANVDGWPEEPGSEATWSGRVTSLSPGAAET